MDKGGDGYNLFYRDGGSIENSAYGYEMKSKQPKSDKASTGIVKAIGAVAAFILAVPFLCVFGIFGVFAQGGPLAIISLVVLLFLHWIKRNGWPF